MVVNTYRMSKVVLSKNDAGIINKLNSIIGTKIDVRSKMCVSQIPRPLHIRTKSSVSVHDNDMKSKNLINKVINTGDHRIEGYSTGNHSQKNRKKASRLKTETSPSKKQNTDLVHAENIDQFTNVLLYHEDWMEQLNARSIVNEMNNICVSIPLLTIQYWVAQKSTKGVDNAIQILQKMIDTKSQFILNHDSESADSIHLSSLTTTILNSVLNAGRKYGRESFIKQASQLLESIDQLEKNIQQSLGEKEFQKNMGSFLRPNQKTYNMMIDLISKSPEIDNVTEDVSRILSRMNDPDTYSFNSLLYAWSQRKNSNSAEKCENFLRWMQEQTHNTPDTITYNTIINAWSKSRDPQAAFRAESLLYEMQLLYENGNFHVKPNHITFTSVIDAWGKSDSIDAADKAKEIFDIMQTLYEAGDHTMKPNTITYNSLLNVYAKSVLPATAEKAENILQSMIQLNADGDTDVKPDRISFTTCINAWSKSDEKGSSVRAQGILKMMEELSEKNGIASVSPDLVTYNLLLKCLVSDSVNDKALQAEVILNKMEGRRIRADIMAYNSVIQCCCTTRSEEILLKSHALRIANETLLKVKLSKHIKPNPFTFNFYIKACDRLAKEPEKSKLIKAAWNYCCSSGQLSQPVLSIIKNTLSNSHLEKLFQSVSTTELRKIRVSNFPSEWSAGAVSGHIPHSRQQSELKKKKRNQRRHHRFKHR